mgnify:CR=1 FL=1
MIKKYVYGTPFETEAVVMNIEKTEGVMEYGKVCCEKKFSFEYEMSQKDMIFGLGQSNRGINKRGYIYISNCTDDPEHTEHKTSLYGAHNFIVVSGEKNFGLFVDYPSTVIFDIGYTHSDKLKIECEYCDVTLYVIEGQNAYDIVKQFRKLIGQSYIPPKFAFGYAQSRWGYKTKQDYREVAREYRKNHIPIDMIYMDIDYMQDFKDFTLNEQNFSDFEEFVKEMKQNNLKLIPIIDAGVKIEKGYSVYEEGVKNNYFCKREDGSDFVAAVWPNDTHFPDVLNKEVRKWFGLKYKILTDKGIEGFWNDMNEPAIFYTPEGIERIKKNMKKFIEKEPSKNDVWFMRDSLRHLANNPYDYKSFYHTVDGKKIRHDKVHNLYGYNMTRAAAEGLQEIDNNRRYLLFSRSSYIGMHRYGGIWTGDNMSWWSHLLLNIKMMPSLNMCGFLYTGADIGGFGANTTRELLLRWLAFGIFTPLMRNHSAEGTRRQECYQFEKIEQFKHLIEIRYRLIPYIYSEYMKAALQYDMYFKPLSFVYQSDEIAKEIEDQLLIGNEIMIAPVYTQNAKGRCVYLPEEMMMIKFVSDGTINTKQYEKGYHYIDTKLDEVVLFVRKGCCIPIAEPAEYVEQIDTKNMKLYGYDNSEYLLYDDDGITKEYQNENYKTMKY